MNPSQIQSDGSPRTQLHATVGPLRRLWSAVTESRAGGTELPLSHLLSNPTHSSGLSTVRQNPPRLIPLLVARILFAAFALFAFSGCSPSSKQEVIVYTSQDQVYAEPILRGFSEANDIIVRAVYDSEAVKTVGLANRLLAERSLPQCDVFWNNEALRTFQLAAAEVFRPTEPWAIFGFRSRRLVVNTNLCSLNDVPTSLVELTNTAWRGKVALAYPLFGTTATHFLALRQHWGETNWIEWCQALTANEPLLLDGNSAVVRMVGEGETWIGLTDSDDIAAGQRAGLPIASAPLTPEFLLIPNSVGVVRNGPNPAPAQRLFEYLQSDAVQQALLEHHALEGTTHTLIEEATLKVDWAKMVIELGPATQTLSEIFLR